MRRSVINTSMTESYIKTVAFFLGSRRGVCSGFEKRVESELQTLAGYMARHGKEVLFGAGEQGHTLKMLEAIQAYKGSSKNVVPLGFKSLSQDFCKRAGLQIDTGRINEREVDAILEFKRNFLVPAQAKFVFPGAWGTNSELAASMEKQDVAILHKLDIPLAPIIIINIPVDKGQGYFDALKAQNDMMVRVGRMDASRLKTVHFVEKARQAIALLETYERHGPVSARDINKFQGISLSEGAAPLVPDL